MKSDTAMAILDKLSTSAWREPFKQFNYCQAYIGIRPVSVEVENVIFKVVPIKSYQTIVGFACLDDGCIYEIHKYSRTTSKQFTQICNQLYSDFKRVFIP